jgi:hypothetical protein
MCGTTLYLWIAIFLEVLIAEPGTVDEQTAALCSNVRPVQI